MENTLPEQHNDKTKDSSMQDRESLLSSFLSKISANAIKEIKTSAVTISQPSEDISSLKIEDYPEVEISSETEKRIVQLVNIAKDIEQKCSSQQLTLALPRSKEFKIDYVQSLNGEQFQATLSLAGPILVIAGAGTGKTRVIVHRVAFMLEMGVVPERILLLTFTRKAAREMQSRTEQLLRDTSASRVCSGTFTHSQPTYCAPIPIV